MESRVTVEPVKDDEGLVISARVIFTLENKLYKDKPFVIDSKEQPSLRLPDGSKPKAEVNYVPLESKPEEGKYVFTVKSKEELEEHYCFEYRSALSKFYATVEFMKRPRQVIASITDVLYGISGSFYISEVHEKKIPVTFKLRRRNGKLITKALEDGLIMGFSYETFGLVWSDLKEISKGVYSGNIETKGDHSINLDHGIREVAITAGFPGDGRIYSKESFEVHTYHEEYSIDFDRSDLKLQLVEPDSYFSDEYTLVLTGTIYNVIYNEPMTVFNRDRFGYTFMLYPYEGYSDEFDLIEQPVNGEAFKVSVKISGNANKSTDSVITRVLGFKQYRNQSTDTRIGSHGVLEFAHPGGVGKTREMRSISAVPNSENRALYNEIDKNYPRTHMCEVKLNLGNGRHGAFQAGGVAYVGSARTGFTCINTIGETIVDAIKPDPKQTFFYKTGPAMKNPGKNVSENVSYFISSGAINGLDKTLARINTDLGPKTMSLFPLAPGFSESDGNWLSEKPLMSGKNEDAYLIPGSEYHQFVLLSKEFDSAIPLNFSSYERFGALRHFIYREFNPETHSEGTMYIGVDGNDIPVQTIPPTVFNRDSVLFTGMSRPVKYEGVPIDERIIGVIGPINPVGNSTFSIKIAPLCITDAFTIVGPEPGKTKASHVAGLLHGHLPIKAKTKLDREGTAPIIVGVSNSVYIIYAETIYQITNVLEEVRSINTTDSGDVNFLRPRIRNFKTVDGYPWDISQSKTVGFSNGVVNYRSRDRIYSKGFLTNNGIRTLTIGEGKTEGVITSFGPENEIKFTGIGSGARSVLEPIKDWTGRGLYRKSLVSIRLNSGICRVGVLELVEGSDRAVVKIARQEKYELQGNLDNLIILLEKRRVELEGRVSVFKTKLDHNGKPITYIPGIKPSREISRVFSDKTHCVSGVTEKTNTDRVIIEARVYDELLEGWVEGDGSDLIVSTNHSQQIDRYTVLPRERLVDSPEGLTNKMAISWKPPVKYEGVEHLTISYKSPTGEVVPLSPSVSVIYRLGVSEPVSALKDLSYCGYSNEELSTNVNTKPYKEIDVPTVKESSTIIDFVEDGFIVYRVREDGVDIPVKKYKVTESKGIVTVKSEILKLTSFPTMGSVDDFFPDRSRVVSTKDVMVSDRVVRIRVVEDPIKGRRIVTSVSTTDKALVFDSFTVDDVPEISDLYKQIYYFVGSTLTILNLLTGRSQRWTPRLIENKVVWDKQPNRRTVWLLENIGEFLYRPGNYYVEDNSLFIISLDDSTIKYGQEVWETSKLTKRGVLSIIKVPLEDDGLPMAEAATVCGYSDEGEYFTEGRLIKTGDDEVTFIRVDFKNVTASDRDTTRPKPTVRLLPITKLKKENTVRYFKELGTVIQDIKTMPESKDITLSDITNSKSSRGFALNISNMTGSYGGLFVEYGRIYTTSPMGRASETKGVKTVTVRVYPKN